MKLHIGCGNKIIKGFVNIDVRPLDGVDFFTDIHDLSNFKNQSVKLIYCSHVLEHIPRFEYMDVLRHWYDILDVGGVLRLAVPDIGEVIKHYVEHEDLEVLRGFLWGGQTYKENYHYCGWDYNTLDRDLRTCGFSSVRKYDWKKLNMR